MVRALPLFLALLVVSGCKGIPPSRLAYTSPSPTYVVDQSIEPNDPSSGGGPVTLYAITPDLPAGLSLDSATGTISGTPTAWSPETTYTVTARNEAGTTMSTVQITVTMGAITDFSLTFLHACAVAGGSVRCWGQNWYGQLGNGTTMDSPVPVLVSGLPPDVQAVSTGYTHSCALAGGGVWCWGSGTAGELGNGTWTSSLVPVQVIQVPGFSGVKAITSGSRFTCALAGESIWCWGSNANGALGNGTLADRNVPVPVVGLPMGNVQSITAGGWHMCARIDGAAWCWGLGDAGQLGNGSTSSATRPGSVLGLFSGVDILRAGTDHTCALSGGAMSCWGSNHFGLLGDGTYSPHLTSVPVYNLSSGVQAIAPGDSNTCAIVGGAAQCWGNNQLGQIGDDSTRDSYIPVTVKGLESGVTALFAGGNLACARARGTLWCWGDNQAGTFGNGTTKGSHAPVPVGPWAP